MGLFDIKEFVDSSRDDITAVATVFIAMFTIVLGLFTISLAGSTRIAANAANLSAKAAIAIQLPLIEMRPDDLGWGDIRKGDALIAHCSVHYISISNTGTTRAFPIEIRYGFTVGSPLPKKPHYKFVDRFPMNLTIEPGEDALKKHLHEHVVINSEDWPIICSGKKDVWFYCVFAYEDFMEVKRQVSFCWRWQNVGIGMAWRPDETAAYNCKT